jgi:hypothetical protein
MGQPEGNKVATSGRIGAQIGTALAAGDVALGAGWGTTATKAITAGSNDQAGQIVVTSSGASQAQATATVTITFADGAYASTPRTVIATVTSTSARAGADRRRARAAREARQEVGAAREARQEVGAQGRQGPQGREARALTPFVAA